MRFEPDSWKNCAADFATAADGFSQYALAQLAVLGDASAVGATASRTTLVDDAIAGLVPISVEYISEIARAILDQLVEESNGLYATGQYYRDLELDNTLSSQEITQALAETPYN